MMSKLNWRLRIVVYRGQIQFELNVAHVVLACTKYNVGVAH